MILRRYLDTGPPDHPRDPDDYEYQQSQYAQEEDSNG